MANRLPILILTILTIVLLIGMCTSLPYVRDAANPLESCDKNVPHLVIINDTNGAILNCYKCTNCQPGTGLSTPCNGQNVSAVELDVHCKPCIAGVNFSTGESIQCQKCLTKKCEDGEIVTGKCETDGDKRECKRCDNKDYYYNNTQRMCMPCSCHNVTTEIKQICSGLGISLECNTSSRGPTNSTTSSPHTSDESSFWNRNFLIIAICVIVFFLCVVAPGYACCVKKRYKRLKHENPDVSIYNKESFCPIFCFKAANVSRPTDDRGPPEETRALNPNGNGYLRQHSCPVTANEMCRVSNGFHAGPIRQGDNQENVPLVVILPECKQKKLNFFGMNAEVCRLIYQMLRNNVDTGMGYVTLAGYMGFSKDMVTSFESKGDPCENMLRCWTAKSTKNNVLRLKELVEKLERADILEMLESELQKVRNECDCSACVNVK